MNDGSNSGHVWRDFKVSEFEIQTKTPKVAEIGAIVHDFISVGGRQLQNPRYLENARTRESVACRHGDALHAQKRPCLLEHPLRRRLRTRAHQLIRTIPS